MKLWPFYFVVVALVLPPAVADSSKRKLPDTLILAGDRSVEAHINGRSLKLRVEPDAAGSPGINSDIAQEMGLKGGMISYGFLIGTVMVNAETAVLRNDYGYGPKKQRTMWLDRPISQIADGIIGPSSLPYKIVTFELRPVQQGETIRHLKMESFGFWGMDGVGISKVIDGEEIMIWFDLSRDENMITATAASMIAQQYSGAFSGPSATSEIAYGIQRPVRPIHLMEPLNIAGINISDMTVRISDRGNVDTIPDGTELPSTVDEGEIVVTGKKRKKLRHKLTLGRSFLKNCSSLTYDLAKKEIRLSCT